MCTSRRLCFLDLKIACNVREYWKVIDSTKENWKSERAEKHAKSAIYPPRKLVTHERCSKPKRFKSKSVHKRNIFIKSKFKFKINPSSFAFAIHILQSPTQFDTVPIWISHHYTLNLIRKKMMTLPKPKTIITTPLLRLHRPLAGKTCSTSFFTSASSVCFRECESS